MSYRLITQSKIKVLAVKGSPQGDDFPYRDFPVLFPRKPVSIVPVPYETAKLLAIDQEIDDDEDWLSEDDHTLMAQGMRTLRHEGFSDQVNRHQIGGFVRRIQPHEHVKCLNKKCRRHKLFKESKSFHMKELATIHDDPKSASQWSSLLANSSALQISTNGFNWSTGSATGLTHESSSKL